MSLMRSAHLLLVILLVALSTIQYRMAGADVLYKFNPYVHFRFFGYKGDICKMQKSFDVITAVNDGIVIFAGKYIYLKALDTFMDISTAYNQLPGSLERIDAYYVGPYAKEYFFVGRMMYVLQGSDFHYAGELSEFGFDLRINHIDTVFKYDNQLVITSGVYYWNATEEMTNITGPYKIENLIGERMPITSAFTDVAGETHVVIKTNYWPLDTKAHKRVLNKQLTMFDLICKSNNPDWVPPECCKNHIRYEEIFKRKD